MNGLWMWRTDHQTTHLFKWPNNERRKTMRGLMTVCRLWWRWGVRRSGEEEGRGRGEKSEDSCGNSCDERGDWQQGNLQVQDCHCGGRCVSVWVCEHRNNRHEPSTSSGPVLPPPPPPSTPRTSCGRVGLCMLVGWSGLLEHTHLWEGMYGNKSYIKLLFFFYL